MARRSPSPVRAFTLIELIVVMAVLATVLAISAPALSRFARGRSLEEEANRFLALTHYARSEAISRSVPMVLWIDREQGEYGLGPMTGYEYDDGRPVDFELEDDLRIEIGGVNLDRTIEEPRILFWPDGTLDELSLDLIWIRDRDDYGIPIQRADYGMGYEIPLTENGERQPRDVSPQSR